MSSRVGARSGDGAGFVLLRRGVRDMREPIDREAVRAIVRGYHPGADPGEVEYVTRRAVGAAEVALFDAIRTSAPAGQAREPVRDAAFGRR